MPNPPKKVIDTWSGRIFPALNECYQTLLREGGLEEMRKAGKLPPPQDYNFGYYDMCSFYSDRFIQEDDPRWREACQSSGQPSQGTAEI